MTAAAFKLQKIRGPKARALEVVARGRCSKETLRKRLSRELRDLPKRYQYLRIDDRTYSRAIRELLKEGEIELDKKRGFIWLEGVEESTDA